MMGLTPDPFVRTIFVIFLCLLMIMLVVLVIWGLEFLHQCELTPKVVNWLKCPGAQILYFISKFETQLL